MCTFDADAVAPYFLEIAGKEYEIDEHGETESGECHMVLRDAAAVLEIQRLLQERSGALKSCALKEAVADRPPEPLYGHHDLRVVEARQGNALVVAVKGEARPSAQSGAGERRATEKAPPKSLGEKVAPASPR